MRIHADDTEQDTWSNAALLEKIQDSANQQALVATSGDFMTAIQTSNADITSLTNDEYSNVDTFNEIKEACDSGNCEEVSLESEDLASFACKTTASHMWKNAMFCDGVLFSSTLLL